MELTQAQLDEQNKLLGRTQFNTGPAKIGNSLSSNTLSTSDIKLPGLPQDTTNYDALLRGGQSAIDFYNKSLKDVTQTNTQSDFLKEFLAPESPTSSMGLYDNLSSSAGLDSLRQDKQTQQKSLKTAMDKLSFVNAQLAGVNAEAQAIPTRLQQEATGRGITKGGLAPIQTGELRNLVLRALPLQAQAVAAQAEVQAAQGNVELSQNMLTEAQSRVDQMFSVVSKDIQAQYDYRQNVRKTVYDYLDKQEQRQIDALNKKDDRTFKVLSDNLNFIQGLAKEAYSNGQAVGAQLMGLLDPNSPNFADTKIAASYARSISPKTGEIDTRNFTKEGQNIMNTVKNLRYSSVEESKRIQSNIASRLASGDVEGAITDLHQFGYEKMSAVQKGDYDLYSSGISAFESAHQQIKDSKIGAGPYKALYEKAKPWVAIQRDKAYTDLRSTIELGQAQIRKGFYGTAVTSTEAGNARNFLIMDSDTIDSMAWKIDNAANFLQFSNDATIARQVGLPKPKLDDYLTYRVREKSTGKTGSIPRSEYNSGAYEIIAK